MLLSKSFFTTGDDVAAAADDIFAITVILLKD